MAVSYALAMWGVGKAFGGKAGAAASIFSAGVALAPGALAALAASLLSMVSLGSLAQRCMVFGGAVSVLLVNAAMLDLHNLPTRRAVLATPLVLVASVALTRAFLAVL